MSGKMNSILALVAISAMMSTTTKQGRVFDLEDNPTPKKIIPAGCKEYEFYGHTVIAINEKSARRKCKKLAGIL